VRRAAAALASRARETVRRVRHSQRDIGMALADQSAVSLTSFATTLVIGRTAGPSALALYALGVTSLLVVTTVQDSLMSAPYTIYGQRLSRAQRANYAGSTLVFCGALALVAATLLAGGGLLLLAGFGSAALGHVLLVAAAVAPAVVLREFARRVSAADLHMGIALVLDVAVGVLQLAGLAWLVSRGAVSAESGLALAGLASGIGAAAWLAAWHWSGRIRVHVEGLGPAWRQHWALGRWVAAGRLIGQLNSDMLLLWVLTFSVGAATAGAFAACLTLAFIANPLVLGAGLFLTPALAARAVTGGVAAVARHARATMAMLGVAFLAFVSVIAVVGEPLLATAYGPAFAGFGLTATIVAAAVGIGALSLGPTTALLVVERPALDVVANLLGLGALIAGAAALIPAYGATGAALAFVAGNTVQLLARLVLLARVVAGTTAGSLAPMETLTGEEAI